SPITTKSPPSHKLQLQKIRKMKFKTTFALVALFLAFQGEVNDRYELDDTINATVSSANGLINNALNYYRDNLVVCPDLQFKTQIISTNALCQLREDFGAMDN
ncbi:hypothetical protein BGZ49_010428, partial [Haplosporangium sp. Z 27]